MHRRAQLEQLAARARAWVSHHPDPETERCEPSDSLTVAASLLAAQPADASPAELAVTPSISLFIDRAQGTLAGGSDPRADSLALGV